MPILIETVRISNFRPLKNIEAVLSSLAVLVGANNSGKTSFLKALNLSLGVERRGLLSQHEPELLKQLLRSPDTDNE